MDEHNRPVRRWLPLGMAALLALPLALRPAGEAAAQGTSNYRLLTVQTNAGGSTSDATAAVPLRMSTGNHQSFAVVGGGVIATIDLSGQDPTSIRHPTTSQFTAYTGFLASTDVLGPSIQILTNSGAGAGADFTTSSASFDLTGSVTADVALVEVEVGAGTGFASAGVVSFTPGQGGWTARVGLLYGAQTVTVRATDGSNLSASDSVVITSTALGAPSRVPTEGNPAPSIRFGPHARYAFKFAVPGNGNALTVRCDVRRDGSLGDGAATSRIRLLYANGNPVLTTPPSLNLNDVAEGGFVPMSLTIAQGVLGSPGIPTPQILTLEVEHRGSGPSGFLLDNIEIEMAGP